MIYTAVIFAALSALAAAAPAPAPTAFANPEALPMASPEPTARPEPVPVPEPQYLSFGPDGFAASNGFGSIRWDPWDTGKQGGPRDIGRGYPAGPYRGPAYPNGGYPNGGYPNPGYQNGGYQNGGYQNNRPYVPAPFQTYRPGPPY